MARLKGPCGSFVQGNQDGDSSVVMAPFASPLWTEKSRQQGETRDTHQLSDQASTYVLPVANSRSGVSKRLG